MRILIATPAFGGFVYTGYVNSLLKSMIGLQADGIEFGVHLLEKESLIGRARNRCARSALMEGYDKMLFIDADMTWEYADMKRLLESDKLIIGGTYPIKNFPISLNFNALDEHVAQLPHKYRSLDGYKEFAAKFSDEKGEVEVRHVPTGFMLIDRKVLEKLAETQAAKAYVEYDAQADKTNYFCEFFPTGVTGHEFESEDWAFCRMAKENGFPVYLNVHCVLGHIGNHQYGLGQHVITGQTPLIKP